MRPIVLGAHLGYAMVGEAIDPQDWNLFQGELGYQTRRTGEDIAKSVMDQIGTQKANVILLHDAGGDRSATIKALHIFVPQLQAQGYEFVLVSNLVGSTRDQVMPAISKSQQFITWIDGFVFGLIFSFFRFLGWAFTVAIGLGIARVAFVTSLALSGAVVQFDRPQGDDLRDLRISGVLLAVTGWMFHAGLLTPRPRRRCGASCSSSPRPPRVPPISRWANAFRWRSAR